MKRFFVSAFFSCFMVWGAQAQLLYKISGKELTKPSYIIGTYHLANVGFVESVPGLKNALDETEQVYGEVDMSDMRSTDNMQKIKRATTLPEGKKLSTLLTKDQLKRLNAYLKEAMGADLNNPAVAKQFEQITPAALTTQLTLLMFMRNHMGEFDPMTTFDEYFQKQAKANNEPVGGLETVEFQIKTLFESTPLKRQVEQLMCLIDHAGFNEQMSERIVKAFYAQDLDAIKAAMDEKMHNNCDSSPEEENMLIYDRNADWAEKMPAIMAAKPTFFAVGVGHLPGDKGVLNLLRTAGYTVEGVK